ncbi:FAD-dependent oxidoreductase domain-containing protein 2-like [Ptychodera flava]|uniref:FAD-dependent oxidoreductase domain-containing protein 2-like n=1 Tax=Ptychodera flava TaxID=63121 RepID=UPI00396A0539
MRVHHETIIVGAGPAGLQMGHFMNKAQRDYVILEASNQPGYFFTHEPRHRVLISINKRFNPFPEFEYNMRHDWNSLLSDDRSLLFPKYSSDLFPKADEIVNYLSDFAKKLEIKITYDTRVNNISKENRPGSDEGLFYLKTSGGIEYSCKVLIMATGALSERLPDIPGIELADTYAKHDLDTRKYEGKLVAIVGQGNSAFEVADYLSPYAAYVHIYGHRPLKFAWNTHFVGDLRAINNNVLEMYGLNGLHSYLFAEATELSKPEGEADKVILHSRELVLHSNRQSYFSNARQYDYVIVCTGWNYVDTSLFADNCKPATKKDGKFPLLKTNWESDSVENLFFMGTSMQANDRKAASGFIHGFRYNVRTMHHMMEERYHKVPYPVQFFPRDCTPVANKLVDRASVDAAIYQLNTFLGDVVIVPDDPKDQLRYYADLPMDYVMEQDWFKNAKHAFTMVHRYNFERFDEYSKDPLSFTHWPHSYDPHCQAFLRPTLTYYQNGKYVDETGGGESLVLRFDVQELTRDNPDKNRNLFKNFINKYLHFNPGAKYNEFFLATKEAYDIAFVPLTEEEKSRIPQEFYTIGGINCKPPTMDLLPVM